MSSSWVSPTNINTSVNAPTNWSQYTTPAAAGFGALASAFPTIGSSSGTTSSLLNTLQSLTGSTTGTTTQGYGTAGTAAIANLLPMLNQLSSNTNLQPYQAQQTQNINQQANSQSANVNAEEAARGLATSPAAATAAANIQAQRGAAVTNLNQQIPLLQNQLTQQNSAAIGNILSILPKVGTTAGTTGQTSSSNQTGTTQQQVQTQQGGGLAGIFGGIGQALSNLF